MFGDSTKQKKLKRFIIIFFFFFFFFFFCCCKKQLGEKKPTQNDLWCAGENRLPITLVLKCLLRWQKVYKIYTTYFLGISKFKTHKLIWALHVKSVLARLMVCVVRIFQWVEKVNNFLLVLKTRAKYIFMQEWHKRFEWSSRASLFFIIADIRFIWKYWIWRSLETVWVDKT